MKRGGRDFGADDRDVRERDWLSETIRVHIVA